MLMGTLTRQWSDVRRLEIWRRDLRDGLSIYDMDEGKCTDLFVAASRPEMKCRSST